MSQEELFEKTAASRLTRRTIVSTGTKLAYAAPVMAASIKLGTLSASATHTPGHEGVNDSCEHSIGTGAFDPEGCKGTCKDKCPSGNELILDSNASDPCEQLCDALCKNQQGNICDCDDACDPASFTCGTDGSVSYSGDCGSATAFPNNP